MMLMCCSDCQYRGARPRRTLYGPGVWCSHPENRDSVPRGVLHAASASVECIYARNREAPARRDNTPVVKVRRRIPVSGTA